MVIVRRAQFISMDGTNGQNSKQISIIVRQKMENFILYFVNGTFQPLHDADCIALIVRCRASEWAPMEFWTNCNGRMKTQM